jgi:AraC-like DNA-binding protein
MINLQDFIGNSNAFKKFEVDDLLFTEFKCPGDEAKSSIWWHNNFFSYVVAGETVLQTPRGSYTIAAGDCVFAKRGSVISHGHIHEDFCELLIFIPDDFIKSVVQKLKIGSISIGSDVESDTVIPLATNEVLESYFHSLLTYFRQSMPPPKALLKLKFEELLVNILSNNEHRALSCYFNDLCALAKPSIQEIMEANFFSNMSLDEFARLCNRSLTAFKEEFKNIFRTTPGKWLLKKRLEYSRYLLETTDNTIAEICYESGFENISHFNRVFKSRYGQPPGRFKMQKLLHSQIK